MRRSTRAIRRLHLLARLALCTMFQCVAAIGLLVLGSWALAYWLPGSAQPSTLPQPVSSATAPPEARGPAAEVLPPAEPDPERAWLNLSTGTRHAPGCRYHGGGFGRPCGDDEGLACKICGG